MDLDEPLRAKALRLKEQGLEKILADELTKHGFYSMADEYLLQGISFEEHFAWKVALAAMRRAAAEEREACAVIADEFARPGKRAPADLGADNGLWNNCADRIATCIRAATMWEQDLGAERPSAVSEGLGVVTRQCGGIEPHQNPQPCKTSRQLTTSSEAKLSGSPLTP